MGGVLVPLGEWCVLIGGLAMVAAAVLGGLTVFVPAIAKFADKLIELAVIGFITILAGAALIWLGNNPWLLVTCLVLTGLFLAVRYRSALLRFFHIAATPATKRRVDGWPKHPTDVS